MKKGIRSIIAALAAVFLCTALLAHSFNSTVLSEEFVFGTLEEKELYFPLVEAAEGRQMGELGLSAFLEAVGIPGDFGLAKKVVNGAVSSTLSFLREPSAESIEFGLPSGFSPDSTVLLGEVIPGEAVERIKGAKPLVQGILIVKDLSVIAFLGMLAILIIYARGIKKKARLAGFSLLTGSFAAILLSFPVSACAAGYFSPASLGGGKFGETIALLVQSLASGFSSLAVYCSLFFLALGLALLVLPAALEKTVVGKGLKKRFK